MAVFRGEAPDRVPVVDYFWGETIREWRSQGLPCETREELQYVFDHDLIYFYFDPRFGFPERVVDEDGQYRTIYTADGETLRIPLDESNTIRKSDVTGIPVGYTVRDRASWEAHKEIYAAGEWRLYSSFPLSGPWLGGNASLSDVRQKYALAKGRDKFTCLVFRDPYEAVREFVGTDGMLCLMAQDPRLVAEMLDRSLAITLEMIDLVESLGMPMDGYWVWGDIAYSNGMFFSPTMYRELLMPRHQRLFDRLGPNFIYHTDGNLATCLPLLVESGIRGINPIEIKAGNDFSGIAETWGNRLVLTGGIDVTVLSTNDMTRIETELREKLRAARGKKYIYHSDHSIPPTMTLSAYRLVMDIVRNS